jgi:hypothetical protein
VLLAGLGKVSQMSVLTGVDGVRTGVQEQWQSDTGETLGDNSRSRDLAAMMARYADFSASVCLQAWCEEGTSARRTGQSQMRSEMNRPGSE